MTTKVKAVEHKGPVVAQKPVAEVETAEHEAVTLEAPKHHVHIEPAHAVHSVHHAPPHVVYE